MQMEDNKKVEELADKINSIITKNGALVSGMGILAENTKKMIEILDKIQKFMYFMEKRQDEMFKFMKEKSLNI
jgi:hypothetical protein